MTVRIFGRKKKTFLRTGSTVSFRQSRTMRKFCRAWAVLFICLRIERTIDFWKRPFPFYMFITFCFTLSSSVRANKATRNVNYARKVIRLVTTKICPLHSLHWCRRRTIRYIANWRYAKKFSLPSTLLAAKKNAVSNKMGLTMLTFLSWTISLSTTRCSR